MLTVLPVVHVTGYLRTLGGMQTVLRHHLAQDGFARIDSRQVVLFERQDPEPDRVEALGWNWRSTIHGMRRSFGAVMRRSSSSTVIYHNFWGLPFLADLDPADRRVGYLHACPKGIEATLKAQQNLVDGVLANSQTVAELTARGLPELAGDRIQVVPLAITPPPHHPIHPPLVNRPLVLGYSGRLVRELKRVDRLPELARHLDLLGVAYRMEILGNGRDATWLRGRFHPDAPVVWHGAKSGKEYWDILGSWDVMINVSDSEAISISLLEALSCGVIPLFPGIASGGVTYVQKVNCRLVYRAGDMAAAADAAKTLVGMPQHQWNEWRGRCREAVKGHLGSEQIDVFRSFLDRIARLPRLSRGTFAPRPASVKDFIPLGLLARVTPQWLLR